MAVAVDTPELDAGKFRNPRADQALLTAERSASAAQDAALLAGAFIAFAMPPGFLERNPRNLDRQVRAGSRRVRVRYAGQSLYG